MSRGDEGASDDLLVFYRLGDVALIGGRRGAKGLNDGSGMSVPAPANGTSVVIKSAVEREHCLCELRM